jgi:hypothetical protein
MTATLRRKRGKGKPKLPKTDTLHQQKAMAVAKEIAEAKASRVIINNITRQKWAQIVSGTSSITPIQHAVYSATFWAAVAQAADFQKLTRRQKEIVLWLGKNAKGIENLTAATKHIQ